MGWTSLLLGLFIIHEYNYWIWNITLFVTVLGWAYFVRGLLIMFVPQFYLKTETNEKNWITAGGIIRLIFGIAISWIAMQ
jgi:hypothetical protein